MADDARDLQWDGCFNVRDFGGLAAGGGRLIQWGALVRADSLDQLTAEGWAAAQKHGIRTVVDLRNAEEYAPATVRPAGIELIRVPVDELAGGSFAAWWEASGQTDGTPLAFSAYLDLFPQVAAGIVSAVAAAGPGGVAVHCAAGRDRTGFASFVLLALAGVAAEVIAADYARSTPNLRRAAAAWGREDDAPALAAILARAGTSAERAIAEMHARFDPWSYLTDAGVSDRALVAVRKRLLSAQR